MARGGPTGNGVPAVSSGDQGTVDLVSDGTFASDVEKENTIREGAGVGVKRRRVPGIHHDLVVDDAPDGYPLSQVDEETGEVRTNLVSWKSVSPPRFRSGLNPNASGGSARAGGAVVHQLLRIGRGSAQAMQQAKAREDTRRRVCERLDTWDDENANGAEDKGGTDAQMKPPNERATSTSRMANANANPTTNPNETAAASLLADVQAMSDWADARATPGSTGRPSIGALTQKTPVDFNGRDSLDVSRLSVPPCTAGQLLSTPVVVPPSVVPQPGPPVPAPAAVPSATGTVPSKEKNAPAPEPKKDFACNWGDDFDIGDFDLATAAAVAEAGHRKKAAGGVGVLVSELHTNTNTNAEPPKSTAEPNGASNAAQGDVKHTTQNERTVPALPSYDPRLRQKEIDSCEMRVETEGASLGAFRVKRVTRRENGRLDLSVRRCVADYDLSNCENDKGNEQNNEITIHLHDSWSDTHVLVGDTCLVASPFNSGARRPQQSGDPVSSLQSEKTHLNDDSSANQNEVIDITMDGDQLLVMHPGVMINSTTVGGSMQCLRRSVLQTVVPDNGGGDGGQAALLGTLSHDLCEGSLLATAFNKGPGAIGFYKHADIIVNENVGKLFASGVTEQEAVDRLRYVGPGVHKWSRALVRRNAGVSSGPVASAPPGVGCEVLDGPGRSSAGNVVLTKMVDAEETVWAPKFGLRGVIDAVAVGKLETPPVPGVNTKPSVSSGIVPVELKTGYWRSPVEHGAQLTLYTLMLAERYKQRVPFGLLHYTRHPGGQGGSGLRNKKDDETIAIRPGKRDHAFLMLRRNLLAGALNQNRGGLIGIDDENNETVNNTQTMQKGVSFALGTLPPMDQCRSQCERCFVRDTCFTVNAALEGGGGNLRDASVAGLAMETVGHLTPNLTSQLKKWLSLVDQEASVSAARRATPWMPVRDVRRRGAFTVSGLTFLPSKRNGHKTTKSERFNCAYDDDVIDRSDRSDTSLKATAPRPYLYTLAVPPTGASKPDATESDSELLSSLRPGDRLVLSREHGEIVVGRVIVVETGVTLFGRTQKTQIPFVRVASERAVRFEGPGAAVDNNTWRVDKDDGGGTMSGRARSALIETFASPDVRAENIRKRLFDLNAPDFNFEDADKQLSNLSHSASTHVNALNDEQRGAVRSVLAAKDYALIRGLPGAGKSATLCAIVAALVDSGKSVLVTSHTHTAVDNVLERLPSVGVHDFVRAGGEDGKASAFATAYAPGGAKHNARSVQELQQLADSCNVVGATCYAAANHPIITRRRVTRGVKQSGGGDVQQGGAEENMTEEITVPGFFDVVLVDEAGQMTLPSSLPPLLRGSVFVLVGDPLQLPPLVQSDHASLGGLSTSPMQLLSEAHPTSVAELRTQYRMAEDLAKISNVISYGGRLRAANAEIANRTLHLRKPSPAGTPGWLMHATDPHNRVVFLDTSAFGVDAYETNGTSSDKSERDGSKNKSTRGNKHVNMFERDVILRVLGVLKSRGAMDGTCAVLSPYNSQVDLLESDLQKHADDVPENTQALTIDRAQGRDVDCVLISFVRGNEGKDSGRLLADRRRLNVAFTRAKCKLVLVGCGDTLCNSPVMLEVMGLLLGEQWNLPLKPETF